MSKCPTSTYVKICLAKQPTRYFDSLNEFFLLSSPRITSMRKKWHYSMLQLCNKYFRKLSLI